MMRTGVAPLAVSLLAVVPATAGTQVKKSDSVLKVTATVGKIENDKQTVTITITIDKPWHIYANPVKNMDLESGATVVDITGKTKPKSVKIEYPAGKVEKDETVGDYMIYEDKVVIKAEVVRAKGDTEPLKASIKVQACTSGKSGTCLLPATVAVEVK